MAGQQDQQQSDPAAAAIEHVLKVERDGVQQLQRSQEHAQQLLAQARAAGGCDSEGGLMSAFRNCTTAICRRCSVTSRGLRNRRLSSEHADDAYDRMTLVQAARRVAAKLTGGG